MKIRLSREARAELADIQSGYRKSSRALARDFVAQLRVSGDLISQFPELGPRVGRYRRVTLQRFPYWLVYEVAEDGIEIVSVVHHAAGYWRFQSGFSA